MLRLFKKSFLWSGNYLIEVYPKICSSSNMNWQNDAMSRFGCINKYISHLISITMQCGRERSFLTLRPKEFRAQRSLVTWPLYDSTRLQVLLQVLNWDKMIPKFRQCFLGNACSKQKKVSEKSHEVFWRREAGISMLGRYSTILSKSVAIVSESVCALWAIVLGIICSGFPQLSRITPVSNILSCFPHRPLKCPKLIWEQVLRHC